MTITTIPTQFPEGAPSEFTVKADLYDTRLISNEDRSNAHRFLQMLMDEAVKRGYEIQEWFDDVTLVQTVRFRRV